MQYSIHYSKHTLLKADFQCWKNNQSISASYHHRYFVWFVSDHKGSHAQSQSKALLHTPLPLRWRIAMFPTTYLTYTFFKLEFIPNQLKVMVMQLICLFENRTRGIHLLCMKIQIEKQIKHMLYLLHGLTVEQAAFKLGVAG